MRSIPIIEKNGILVISLDANALNESNAMALRQLVHDQLQSREHPRVAIGLAGVDFISSTGIAFLIGTKRRIESAEGQLVLFSVRPEILEVFGLMRLVSLFEIADHESAAMALFPPGRSS